MTKNRLNTEEELSRLNMCKEDDERGSISASEDEDNTDPGKHAKLLDAISSLHQKQKVKMRERTVPVTQVSEYNFISTERKKVALHELLGTVQETSKLGSLKKKLRTMQKKNKLISVPLPKREKQKMERAVTYESTSKDITKWDPIVKENRKAEQIIFPMQKSTISVHTTNELIKRFQPHTPLEVEVAAALAGSTNVPRKNKYLTSAEKRALKAMSWEEARERHSELMEYRALLSYKEAKARWQSRIKSKKYHRLLKKEKLRKEKGAIQELQQNDPVGYQEKLDNKEKQRIQERMSLKHKAGSKFIRKRMMYSKYNDQTRQQVHDMLQKNRELTQKQTAMIDSEGEEREGGMLMNQEDEMLENLMSDNPWMPGSSRKGKEFSMPENEVDKEVKEEDITEDRSDSRADSGSKDDEIMSDLDGNVNRKGMVASGIVECSIQITSQEKSVSPKILLKEKKQSKSNEDNIEHIFLHLEDESKIEGKKWETDSFFPTEKESLETKKISKKAKRCKTSGGKNKAKAVRKRKCEESANKEEEEWISGGDCTTEDTDNGTFMVKKGKETDTKKTTNMKQRVYNIKRSNIRNSGVHEVSQSETNVIPKKFFMIESKVKACLPDVVEEGYSDQEPDNQRMTIAQAFEDDDVVEEFSREKKEMIDRDKPKPINLTLPGWGSWGGTGIIPSKGKMKRFIIKDHPSPPRNDMHLGNVIISELKDKVIDKYQVNDLPFPFGHVQQFEHSIRAPIGKTWNPETAFKQLVKPKVVTTLGKVINPLDKDEVFTKQKSKER